MVIASPRLLSILLFLALSLLVKDSRAAGRLLTSGILYATSADAVATNPASLADDLGGSSTGRLAYDNPADGYAAMYASTSGSSGKGIALNAAGSSMLTLGGGFKARAFHMGANISLPDLDPGSADIGIGLLIGDANGLRIGGTMSSALKSESNAITLGIGYASLSSYQIEFDLRSPMSTFSAAGQHFTQTLKAVYYFSRWGLGAFETSSAGTSPLAVASPTFGGMLQYSWTSQTSIDFYFATAGDPSFGFGFLSRFQ